jgi:cell division transport system permease protein
MIAASIRIVRFALQDLARNAWLSVATVSVLVMTLVTINILVAVSVLGNLAIGQLQARIDVSVHFKPEVEDSRVQTVKISLLSLPEVKDVLYVSPAESLAKFSEANKADPRVVESLGEIGTNPFGATLVIKAREIGGFPKIMAALGQPALSELIEDKDFEDRQGVIDRLSEVSRRLQLAGLFLALVFGFITMLIVWNTVRMSIYTRRDELGIMRLVGASDWFIRAPFYVQTVIWGVAALSLCVAMLLPAFHFAEPLLARFFGTPVDLLGFYIANGPRLLGLELAGVILVCVVTTKMATGKYLKV